MSEEIIVTIRITEDGVSSEIKGGDNISETQVWKLVQGYIALEKGISTSTEEIAEFAQKGINFCKFLSLV